MKKIIIGNNLLGKLNSLFNFDQFSKIAVLTDENIQVSLISQISQIKKISKQSKKSGKQCLKIILTAVLC